MTVQEMVDVLNNDGKNFTLCLQLEELIDNNNIEEAIGCLKKHFNCDKETANQCFIEFKKQIYDELKKIESENPLSTEQIAYNNATARELLNKPKCPTCGSTNIKPISALNRGASIAMWGVFSKKINKSYKCKHCGYTW